jgi:predicted GH43/DUF377 family glycosyl hydrolase/DNA-binding beta-propeller fold protein YncE
MPRVAVWSSCRLAGSILEITPSSRYLPRRVRLTRRAILSTSHLRDTVLLLTLLTGCIQDAPLPDLGACADYPEGIYEYGEIGIGTCLAGPTELAVVEDDAGAWTILVTNANPYQLFTGGSLLTIPWDNIDLSTGRNVVSDLSPVALDMPDFAGPLAITDDLAMVGVRYSEDARTRVASDEVYLVDVSDPAAPARSDRGPSGADTITVQSDPVSIVVDEETGLAFVANRTDHTISVIDTTGEELEIVLPWPEHVLNAAVFDDADGSGSTAVLADLEELEAENLDDDTWTMTWIAGTWRLWLPRDGALYRLTTTGNGIYTDSALGDELDPAEETTIEEVVDPFHFLLTGQLLFTSGGDIWAAVSDEYLGDWVVDSSALVTAQDGETLGGPSLLSASEVYWLYFDAEDESGFTINLAASEDGSTFSRYSTPVLEPTYDHELSGIQQPYVFYDWQADQWRMFYSAFDGARWTIGHAVSDDLLTWTADAEPIFSLDDVDVAAPVVSMEAGSYRMWYARRADGEEEWSFAAAESIAGLDWSEQEVLDATPVAQDTPPRPALQSGPTAAFRVESELVGNLSTELSPGETLSTSQGWSASALAGYWLGTDAVGSRSEGGIRIDSIDTDAGLAWLTLTGAAGTPRIGLATIDALGVPTAESDAIFAGEGGYDADGVSSPVVWRHTDGTWRMAYAAHDGDFTTTALATSSDGRSWSRVGEIITNGPDWDSVSVVPSAIQTTSTGWRLWYSGFNGDSWEIGSASSADGETWTRDSEQPVFEAGSAGDWDDSGVQDAWLLSDDGSISGEVGDHMWYAGFDGDSWRIGYAWRADGSEDWVRAETVETEEPRPVLTTTGGMFHPSGLHRPVVTAEGGDLTMWYAGLFGEVERVGQAIGREPARLFKSLRRPTVGDTLSFDTERGDESVEAIPLDGSVETLSVTGVGLTSLDLDAERGFLYVTSKLLPYIIVIDVRDDSTEDFSDLNYLDIEAVMVANTLTDSSGSGYRKVIAPAGSEHLYAINDSPESVFILDTSELVDDAYGDWIYATQIGWLPTPVSNRDAGVDSQTPIGPAQMAFHPDRDQLLVTNFNANSISAYDLALGPYGTLVREVTLIGENPYAITITPDGLHAVFANYSGEVDPDGLTEASLGILDLDPTSPTYLTVLTWITNR